MKLKSIPEYLIVSLSLLLVLVACGGGHGNSSDIFPNAPPGASGVITGPNSFLLFPNEVINTSGVSEIDSAAYTNAYYAAIDPSGVKDTYTKWKAANGFDSGTGTQINVVVGDSRDLGYGRHITARKNADGTMAFSVRNYLVWAAAGYGYSSVNLDAAVVQDNRWYIGASNIEFSPGPKGGVPFAKFYFFNPDGSRASEVNLDGRGNKWMPGPCITCHGGRADPLTPAGTFPLVQNAKSLTRGDVQGHMHPLEPDSFEYSTKPGFTRADQEAALKILNTWILQSYPLPCVVGGPTCDTIPVAGSSVTGFAEDTDRRVATKDEWQGVAAALIKDGYGGNGLPNAKYVDAVPASWVAAGQSSLYQNTVVPSCRICHVLRGAGSSFANSLSGTDVDLTDYAKFNSYADQIKLHSIDRGNMPLAKILYEKFWSTPSISDTLANYLQGAGYTVRDAAGALLKPGRPIADPGPGRTVKQGATLLSGIASQYATNYQWSIVSGAASAVSLSNENSRDATFTATADGAYVVQLVVDNGKLTSLPASVNVVVNNLLAQPATIRFSDIKAVLQAPAGCLICHTVTTVANPLPSLSNPAMTPLVYDNVDRNGDGLIDATDDSWMYSEVRGRINFNDPADSPLLLKPAGKHHGGGMQLKFGDMALQKSVDQLAPGDPLRANYDLFLNWILNGAPQ